MKVESLFPTAFCQLENPFLAARLKKPVEDILSDEELLSPFLTYDSTFDPRCQIEDKIELPKVFDEFKEYAYNNSINFLSKIGYDVDAMELSIEFGLNKMNRGDRHQKHVHSGCVLTGTFYVDFPEGSSPLVLHDPRLHREMLPYPKKKTEFVNDRYVTEIKTGSMCLLESYVAHEVMTNNTDGRLVILFNILNR